MTISAAAEQHIKSALDSCTNPSSGTGVAGLVFCSIDKNGEYLTKQASGTIGVDDKTPMDLDKVFWIASCTKVITGIACLQLAEQGKLDLDSSEQLYKVAPELKDVQVLTEGGQLEPKKKEITVRMLLSHTAGFGYTFFNERLRDHKGGFEELSGDEKQIIGQPLVNQPGSRWEYGINIDWAGIVVMRISGLSLDDYFKKNIFEPLGIKNISFFPSEHMKQHLVKSHQRDANGVHETSPHLFGDPLSATDKTKIFNSGGAGCFAKPAEYCLLLAALLNNGTSPNTGAKILSPESVDAMFTNQIPEFPDFGRTSIPAAKPHWTNALPELYPQPGNPAQGWGLTWFLLLEPGPTGHGQNTAWWAGIVNLFYWVDRQKGVAGMIAAQVAPFGDPNVMGTWFGCEKAIYDGLQ